MKQKQLGPFLLSHSRKYLKAMKNSYKSNFQKKKKSEKTTHFSLVDSVSNTRIWVMKSHCYRLQNMAGSRGTET